MTFDRLSSRSRWTIRQASDLLTRWGNSRLQLAIFERLKPSWSTNLGPQNRIEAKSGGSSLDFSALRFTILYRVCCRLQWRWKTEILSVSVYGVQHSINIFSKITTINEPDHFPRISTYTENFSYIQKLLNSITNQPLQRIIVTPK